MQDQFTEWLVEALVAHNREATIVEVCRHIWNEHERDLRAAGDYFYTWQYNVRWAAKQLERESRLEYGRRGRNSLWILR